MEDETAVDEAAAARGELTPVPEGGARAGTLAHLGGDLPPECRALALRLRELFGSVGVSIRVYALRTHQNPATVARYLSGARVPPAEFLDQLAVQAAKATGRPVSEDVLALVQGLQREALQVTDKVGWELQRLRDRLADADRRREQAETLAEVLTDALRERKARIAEMEVDQRRIGAAGAAEREAYGTEIARLRDTEEDLRAERDRLRAEVDRLQGQLDQARRQVMAAEWRCDELEHQLAAAEEKAAGAAVDDPYAEQLDLAEEQRAAAQREAERLKAELAALRAERDEAVRLAAEAARLEEERSAAEAEAAEQHRARSARDAAEQARDSWQAAQAAAEHELAQLKAELEALRAERDQVASARVAESQRALEEMARRQTAQAAAELMARAGPDRAKELAASGADFARDLLERLTVESRNALAEQTQLGEQILEALPHTSPPLTDVPDAEALGRPAAPVDAVVGRVAADQAAEPDMSAQRPVRPVRPPHPGEHGEAGEGPARGRGPAVWASVPSRNALFVGREDLLDAVWTRFQQARAGGGVCVLAGMPGVGKSELAAEYAHGYADRYDLVGWVPAGSRGAARERLAALATELGLSPGGEVEERSRAALGALHWGRPYRHWLIVLDGAEDPDLLGDLLPEGPGDVLITSRDHRWTARGAEVLVVPELRREESVEYLRRTVARGTAVEADALAEQLGDHPLLLLRAARHLDSVTVGPGDFAARIAAGHGWHPAVDTEQLFAPVLNRLRDRSPGAYKLLTWCALFEEGIAPLVLLQPLLGGRDADELAGGLVRKSLLTRVTGTVDTPMVRMHRALRAAVWHRMPAEERKRLIHRIRTTLIEARPGDPADRRSWAWYSAVWPQLQAVGALDDEEAEELVFGCARALHFRGRAGEGRHLAERALAGWQRLGSDHPRLSAMAGLRGALLRSAGEYEHAERLDRAELDRQQHLGGDPDHPERLNALRGLAADLNGLGRYEEAHRITAEVYQGRLRTRGPDHWITHAARMDLADALRLLGRYREALELDEAGVEAMRGRTGDGGTQVLRLLGRQRLALGLRLTGAHRALAVQASVVEEAERLQGADSPLALGAGLELALCELRQGERAGALDRLRVAHGRANHLFGRHAPLTLLALAHLAAAEEAYGRREAAAALAVRSLEGHGAVFGEDHPYTLGAMVNLATTMRTAGAYEEAEHLGRRARTGLEAALGPDHPWTLGAAYDLGVSLVGLGRLEAAHALASDTHQRAGRSLGAAHPLTKLVLELGPGKANHPWPFEPLPV
ncbi:hypothetical protein ACZ90_57600 [Streptomyces albus subsp. albus]|nr:hypothetical protein ACZ90_57600 [Streptomyces albus subsp. albus]